jgi:hypothetical protein
MNLKLHPGMNWEVQQRSLRAFSRVYLMRRRRPCRPPAEINTSGGTEAY